MPKHHEMHSLCDVPHHSSLQNRRKPKSNAQQRRQLRTILGRRLRLPRLKLRILASRGPTTTTLARSGRRAARGYVRRERRQMAAHMRGLVDDFADVVDGRGVGRYDDAAVVVCGGDDGAAFGAAEDDGVAVREGRGFGGVLGQLDG